jgi:CBS domain-containing protein
MIDVDEAVRHRGSTARDEHGEVIGEVVEIYIDDDSGEPAWLLIGEPGRAEDEDGESHFVPIAGADLSDEGVRVAFPKARIISAAGIRGDRHLDADEERALYLHYGMEHEAERISPQPPSASGEPAPAEAPRDAAPLAAEGSARGGDAPGGAEDTEATDVRAPEKLRMRRYEAGEDAAAEPVTPAPPDVREDAVRVTTEDDAPPVRPCEHTPTTHLPPETGGSERNRTPLLAAAIAVPALGALLLAWRRRRSQRTTVGGLAIGDVTSWTDELPEWLRGDRGAGAIGAIVLAWLLKRLRTRGGHRAPRTVRDIMAVDPQRIQSTDTLEVAAVRMRHFDVGALPVCGPDGELEGMLTDRDIVVRVVAEQRNPAVVTVAELMDREPVAVGADETLEDALAHMARHAVRRLPVLEGRRLVGMVSQADLAVHLDDAAAGELLERISSAS